MHRPDGGSQGYVISRNFIYTYVNYHLSGENEFNLGGNGGSSGYSNRWVGR